MVTNMKIVGTILLFILSTGLVFSSPLPSACESASTEKSESHCHKSKQQDNKDQKQTSHSCAMTCCHLSLFNPTSKVVIAIESVQFTQNFDWSEQKPQSIPHSIFRPPIA